MAPGIVLAFDAYGTLLSTESIATKLATYVGEETAKTIAITWRKYQLEYTWRANSMGVYLDFSRFTRRALTHACAESSVSLTDAQADEVMQAYNTLSAFPDVGPMLTSLHSLSAHLHKLVIFSNGTEEMVHASIQGSPDIAPHAQHFDAIVSVDSVRKFKPAPETYSHLAAAVGKNDMDNKKEMGEIWLVSGNPFDVVGGRAMGMNAIFVDRGGRGWEDNMLPGTWSGPTAVVGSLEEVAGVVRKAVNGT